MDCRGALNTKQCVEIAICDAYGEDEQVSGWLVCFEEIFEGVEEIEVLGETVQLVDFDSIGTVLVAVCGKGKYRANVTIDSISLLNATKIQKLWLRAWKSWIGC